jgi:hypothetical protein
MRQRIRFCPTPAGRIAYSVQGTGPILLCDTGWVSHLEAMLDMPTDIARTLFIGPRTAETHVENLLKKLGFRSRAQVAAWVASQKVERGSGPAT